VTAEHTLEPIVTGRRATLVYSLVRTSPGPVPHFPVNPELRRAVQALVNEWAGLPASRQIAVIPLEHRSVGRRKVGALCAKDLWPIGSSAAHAYRYTPTSFVSFQGLKGRDQAVVAHLQACPLLDVTLCLVGPRSLAVERQPPRSTPKRVSGQHCAAWQCRCEARAGHTCS
jgi:hypothetical protein